MHFSTVILTALAAFSAVFAAPVAEAETPSVETPPAPQWFKLQIKTDDKGSEWYNRAAYLSYRNIVDRGYTYTVGWPSRSPVFYTYIDNALIYSYQGRSWWFTFGKGGQVEGLWLGGWRDASFDFNKKGHLSRKGAKWNKWVVCRATVGTVATDIVGWDATNKGLTAPWSGNCKKVTIEKTKATEAELREAVWPEAPQN
ncbi:hypothetical protein Dda_9427 [Drechslerella dactyloides]|uniref:Uncharacterized protein n=1 Tax=Drechslerella dactyloides TaxID=74499 RepID=A0AAD6NF67_DREDA|nr:hypothetical protein Dda_9427 [Drechslerella dactyloides]